MVWLATLALLGAIVFGAIGAFIIGRAVWRFIRVNSCDDDVWRRMIDGSRL